jgi:nitroreductase
MNVEEVIRTKRAVREFTDKPLSDQDVRAILDAGRRSASSKNEQPWYFIAITDKDQLKKLSECGTFAGHLKGAALGIALVKKHENADFDMGQAATTMQLAAWERGIGSCIASMWEPDKAKAILGLPDGLTCNTAISFGFAAKPPADQPRKDGRRPFEDVVRFEKWG